MTIQICTKFPLIHQIAFTSRPDLYVPNDNCLKIKRQFGEENYRLWNFENSRDFLSSYYPKNVSQAFDTLNAFAYKADIIKFCLINTFGGIYADLSINRLKTFSTLGRDMVLFRDGNSDRTSWKAISGFFYSKPNNPILSEAIEQIIFNVRNKYYGHDPHFIGGPSVFGRAIAKYGTEADLLIGQYWWFKYRRNKFVLPGNQVVARGKRGGAYKGGISGIPGGNNYNEMWSARTVYGEITETEI
jgi:mannosyltransferase OCH1-like enzyme